MPLKIPGLEQKAAFSELPFLTVGLKLIRVVLELIESYLYVTLKLFQTL